MLRDTASLLAKARINVSCWMICNTWITCVGCRLRLMLPREWKHCQLSKVTKKAAKKHSNTEVVCGLPSAELLLSWAVLLIALNVHLLSIPFTACENDCNDQCCFKSEQTDFTEVWLTGSYIMLLNTVREHTENLQVAFYHLPLL